MAGLPPDIDPGEIDDVPPGVPGQEVVLVQPTVPAPPTLVGHHYVGQTSVLVDGVVGVAKIEAVFGPLRQKLKAQIHQASTIGGTARVQLEVAIPAGGWQIQATNTSDGIEHPGHPRDTIDVGTGPVVPRFGYHPTTGATGVRVSGVTPGDDVEVWDADGNTLGSNTAGPDGHAIVDVPPLTSDVGIRPVMAGGLPQGPLVRPRDQTGLPWPAPSIDPVYVGQAAIHLRGLRPGCTVQITHSHVIATEAEPFVAGAREQWYAWPGDMPALVAGDGLVITQSSSEGTSDPGTTYVSAAGTAKPLVRDVLRTGDVLLRVYGQVPGHLLAVSVDDGKTWVLRPSGLHPEVEIEEPLKLHHRVKVAQFPDGQVNLAEFSGPHLVERVPDDLGPPTLVPFLFEGTAKALAVLCERGATVRVVREDGVVLGEAWTGIHTSVEIDLHPGLVVGDVVTAFQYMGAAPPLYPVYSSTVTVTVAANPLPTPAILPPAFEGDDQVTVAGNPPGAIVEVQAQLADGSWCSLGSEILADPHGVVHLEVPIPAGATLRAGSKINLLTDWGPELVAVPDPAADGVFAWSAVSIRDSDGLLKGDLVRPLDSQRAPLPVTADTVLILLVAGQPPGNVGIGSPSAEGYRWLTTHWASRGFPSFACSTGADEGGGSVTLAMDLLYASNPEYKEVPLILLGQSNGWPAVWSWYMINLQVILKGAISLGGKTLALLPSNLLPLTVPDGCPVLLVSGGLDYAVRGGNGVFSGYSDYPKPRAAMYIDRACHFGWNSAWTAVAIRQAAYLTAPDTAWPPESITEEEFHDIGLSFFTGFIEWTSDFETWWRIFAGQHPPGMRSAPKLRTILTADSVDACSIVPIHSSAALASNDLGGDSVGYGTTINLDANIRIPYSPGLLWRSPDLVTETLVGSQTPFGLATATPTSLTFCAFTLTESTLTDAAPSARVEPVVSFLDDYGAARPILGLLPQLGVPSGYHGRTALQTVWDTQPADLNNMAQLVSLPVRGLLGLQPTFALGALQEVSFQATPTSSSMVLFDLEAWCV